MYLLLASLLSIESVAAIRNSLQKDLSIHKYVSIYVNTTCQRCIRSGAPHADGILSICAATTRTCNISVASVFAAKFWSFHLWRCTRKCGVAQQLRLPATLNCQSVGGKLMVFVCRCQIKRLRRTFIGVSVCIKRALQ